MSLTTNRDKLIYYAAFVDGEGYLEFNKRPKKNQRGKIYDSHAIKIEVTNTDFNIIQGMKNFFEDGYIYNETTNPNGGGMWRKNRRDNGDGTFGIDPYLGWNYLINPIIIKGNVNESGIIKCWRSIKKIMIKKIARIINNNVVIVNPKFK